MIGRRLPRMLLDEGIHDIAMNVVQPAGLYGDITQIAPLTLANTRQSIVDLGIATDDEVDETLAELDDPRRSAHRGEHAPCRAGVGHDRGRSPDRVEVAVE